MALLGRLRLPDDGPLLRRILLDFGESPSARIAAGAALKEVGGALTAQDLAPHLADLPRAEVTIPGVEIARLFGLADEEGKGLLDAAFRCLDASQRLDTVMRTFGPRREWVLDRAPCAEELPDELLPQLIYALRRSKRAAASDDVARRHGGRLEGPPLTRLVDLLAGEQLLTDLARDHANIKATAIARLALPLPDLVDALGEDGLLARVRAALLDPAADRLGWTAQRLLGSCGPAGVRVAQELLDLPRRQQTWELVHLVMSATVESLVALVARARVLLEAERDLPQVEAVLRLLALGPREVDRDLLVRAFLVPSLRDAAFQGLSALDRDDPTWSERALAFAEDDPVLLAEVHTRRARAGDPSSRETLIELAFTGPCGARLTALEALSELAPERRDLLRRTLVEPRAECRYPCCADLGDLAARALTVGATAEDVALMVEAHLTGPWPLAVAKALEAHWVGAAGRE